jgi:hypothetical protein
MMKVLVSCTLLAAALAVAQTPRSQISGTIASVEAAANQLTLKSDQGESIAVATTDRTLVLRIPPGETDPKKGSKIPLSSVSAGDRAVIVGPAPTGNSWNATAVLVMTKGDLAAIQQKDAEDWKKRGITGTVTAADASANRVTIKSGSHTFTVQPSVKTTWHRYSPDSARFADAKPSSIAEVKTGDQLRVLGDKGSDGASIQAEKIVFGTFRQIAATISAVDAAKGELTVKDLASKKPLILKVDADSTMKKLPDPAARALARRYAAGPESGTAPTTGGGPDVGQMLDRLPQLPLSELKPGDAIMISTTQGNDPARATVIMLLAGVEPLLTASPSATRDIMSGWNLGGGGDSGQ